MADKMQSKNFPTFYGCDKPIVTKMCDLADIKSTDLRQCVGNVSLLLLH